LIASAIAMSSSCPSLDARLQGKATGPEMAG
jgi:hypothetical protein